MRKTFKQRADNAEFQRHCAMGMAGWCEETRERKRGWPATWEDGHWPTTCYAEPAQTNRTFPQPSISRWRPMHKVSGFPCQIPWPCTADCLLPVPGCPVPSRVKSPLAGTIDNHARQTSLLSRISLAAPAARAPRLANRKDHEDDVDSSTNRSVMLRGS